MSTNTMPKRPKLEILKEQKGFKNFQIKNMSKNIVSNLDFFDLPWHMGQITPFGGNVSKSKLVKITHSCMISGDFELKIRLTGCC